MFAYIRKFCVVDRPGHPYLLILFLSLLMVMPVSAQDPAVCPPNALLSYVRAGAVCQQIGRDEICLGNGAVSAEFFAGESFQFDTPGNLIPAAFTEQLSVTTENLEQPNYAVARMELRADLTDPEQRTVTLLVFGNANVTNLVLPAPEIRVVARGTLTIRALPDPQSDILEQIFVRESVLAHGRNEEGTWLRVNIPGTLQRGWVAADVGIVEKDVFSLPVMDNSTPFLRPFQVMGAGTNSEAGLCGDVADGGVLLQTPNPDDQVSLTINGIETRIAGTVFMETGGDVTRFSVLEGIVQVGDVFAPLGTEITLPGGEPITLESRERLLALPTNNLPERVQVPEPATEEEIEARIMAYNAVLPTPVPPPTIPANVCQYIVRRNNTALRAGPGGFFESINTLNAGVELVLVLQTTDADGRVWYQLRNSNWIAADAVSQSGECNPIPVTDFVEAPRTNTVQMETCEASNGPLREGQIVTFEFRPPAADNRREMEQAPSFDPGRLRVENEELRVRYTEPILIASDPERWARIYSATWEAQAGTYRVESARLSYILICELTVRAG